jgi:transcriptional regulator
MVYLPKHFEETREEVLAAFVAENGFADLVTTGAEGLVASQIPILFDASRRVLRGHVAKQNPQAQHFRDGSAALAIFWGPHAYVSPRWYETHPAVPTWNYAAVHVAGKIRAIDAPEALAAIVRELSAKYEADAASPWRFDDLPEPYTRGMLKGIVGFELAIDKIEGKFKLSQNRSERDRRNVAAALAESARPEERALAALMTVRESGGG